MDDRLQRLNTLGILYYVYFGLKILGILILILVLTLMAFQASEEGGILLAVLAGLAIFLSLLPAVCYAITAYALRKHRWWTFCFAISVIACLGFPLGTALGIYSLITLNEPGMKELFAPASGGGAANSAT